MRYVLKLSADPEGGISEPRKRGPRGFRTAFFPALLWMILLTATFVPAQTCQLPAVRKGSPPPMVPLCFVAAQVVQTLNTFNAEAESRALPKLSSVTFSFHTSTAKTLGTSFQILFFTLGANREGDNSNDVSFTYTVPPPSAAQPRNAVQTRDFSQTLLATLEAAAAQVKLTQTIGAATFSNLSVTLGYGVVWDASGGGEGAIGLVTLGGSIDRKRSDVQTLTLSFGP